MASREAMEFRVRGRVQGVGFRYYTRHAASLYGITGWVRNEPDGSVLVRAEGTPDQLQKMKEFLEEGPRYARVAHVEARRVPAMGTYSSFVVEY